MPVRNIADVIRFTEYCLGILVIVVFLIKGMTLQGDP